MCFRCFKKAEVFFKWDKSTVDENFFKNRQFLAKTDIQSDIWIKYINRSSVLAAHYNTQYIYVSVYILEFSSKSAHKCSFLLSLKCRACWPVIPSKNTLNLHVCTYITYVNIGIWMIWIELTVKMTLDLFGVIIVSCHVKRAEWLYLDYIDLLKKKSSV